MFLPAPPHRKLQPVVERRSGDRFLHRQTQRCDGGCGREAAVLQSFAEKVSSSYMHGADQCVGMGRT